ncbi:hypothetical protein HanHA89_Chr14g0544711 [Helianthus annuus]|nr:hypothetical protein HanHA89_Chr14g0544711 [Helianthus annuus]
MYQLNRKYRLKFSFRAHKRNTRVVRFRQVRSRLIGSDLVLGQLQSTKVSGQRLGQPSQLGSTSQHQVKRGQLKPGKVLVSRRVV